MLSKETSLMTSDYYRKKHSGKSIMDYLFVRLSMMYPSQWKASFPTLESIQLWEEVWAESFERKQFSVKALKRGLIKCEDELHDFPPSLPAFLNLCKGEVIPMAHRNIPLMLEQRLTKEQRMDGLKKLRIAKNSITIKPTGDEND
jgi:hypothetical protein